MKICKVCGRKLPEYSFSFNKKRRFSICKKCRSVRETARTLRKRKIKFSRAWYRRRFERTKWNAKCRNIKIELTFEEFCRLRPYKNEKCFYCGATRGLFSLERLDNTKGYAAPNCVVACYRCNKMRSKDYSVEEMKILGGALRKIDSIRNN